MCLLVTGYIVFSFICVVVSSVVHSLIMIQMFLPNHLLVFVDEKKETSLPPSLVYLLASFSFCF